MKKKKEPKSRRERKNFISFIQGILFHFFRDKIGHDRVIPDFSCFSLLLLFFTEEHTKHSYICYELYLSLKFDSEVTSHFRSLWITVTSCSDGQ